MINYLPPKDSEDVCDNEDQADERREAICVLLLENLVRLNDVADAWSQNHA